jgi:hypothetical protein
MNILSIVSFLRLLNGSMKGYLGCSVSSGHKRSGSGRSVSAHGAACVKVLNSDCFYLDRFIKEWKIEGI